MKRVTFSLEIKIEGMNKKFSRKSVKSYIFMRYLIIFLNFNQFSWLPRSRPQSTPAVLASMYGQNVDQWPTILSVDEFQLSQRSGMGVTLPCQYLYKIANFVRPLFVPRLLFYRHSAGVEMSLDPPSPL